MPRFVTVGVGLLAAVLATLPCSAAEGIWQQHGYGKIIEFRNVQARTYDINSVECHASLVEPVTELGELRRLSAQQLEIHYGINRYLLSRVDQLPDACARTATHADDPVLNFESLWHTLDAHYPFFERRGVNWRQVHERYRPRIGAGTSPEELHAVLSEMLGLLGDGHVEIDVPEGMPVAPAPQVDGPANFELARAAQEAIIARYVRQPRAHNAGIVRWGRIDRAIGYVQVNGMLMLADYGIAHTDDLRAFFGEYFAIARERPYQYRDEVEGARAIMARALDDLEGVDALILDLRFNGGGKDGAALEFLRPLLTAPVRAFSKKALDGHGYTEERWLTLDPAKRTFSGRVFVLTSGATASAAEILVLASMQVPRIVRIGSATEGIFSDSLDKTLPNGWEYTLSNEVYETPAGESFEGRGIPPHHVVEYPRGARAFYLHMVETVPAGDAAIETALRLSRLAE